MFLRNLNIGSKFAMSFATLAAMALIISGISYFSFRTVLTADNWNTHSYEVLGHGDELVKATINQETGVRGYLVSGNEVFLEPFNEGKESFQKHLAELLVLTLDNADQQARLKKLGEMEAEWRTKIAEYEINLMKHSFTIEEARQLEASGAGKVLMDRFRATHSEFIEAESSLFEIRTTIKNEAIQLATWSIILGSLFVLCVAALFGYVLSRDIGATSSLLASVMGKLASGNHQIDIPLQDRGDEIGAMANSLLVFKDAAINHRNAELKNMAGKLDHAAYHNQLTGLKNRRAFEEDLDLRISKLRPGFQIYVVQFDLDGFKEVNDTLGHPVGDMVLKQVAEIIKSMCRQSDTVARVGGDEFIILLETPANGGAKRIHKLAERIISRINEPIDINDNVIIVGASAGYAVAKTLPINPDVLVSNADIALYASKRRGKGVATLFSNDMREELEKRSSLTSELKRALDENEFVPFFQPQVSFHDGQVVGFEVLGRWDHPERGILSPAEFIPFAEEIGLINQIDSKISLAALDSLALLRAEGWDIPKISINMSSRSLRLPNFCADLLKSLSIRGLLPRDVVIEVLETSLIESSGDPAVKTVSELSNAGFGIAIDDFGTGYASLSMVVALDISELKIDRSLVVGMESPKGRKVIEAIIALSKGMDLTVVAEGIETSAQFSALNGFGCDVAQGYKVGYPMSQTQTRSWFSRYGQVIPAKQRRNPEIIGLT